MLTVRSRVVELTSRPDFLETPVEVFDEPGRAKLEADAYLAVCANGVADRLVSSAHHQELFLARFSKHITDRFTFASNTQIDPDTAFETFDNAFQGVFKDNAVVSEVMDKTDVGSRTRQACDAYVAVTDKYLTRPEMTDLRVEPEGSHDTYRNPEMLLLAGLSTFSNSAVATAKRVCGLLVGPEQRAAVLIPSNRGMLKFASLSLHQAMKSGGIQARHTRDFVDIAANISDLRELPEYADEVKAITRPRHGCPALPSMPENAILRAGSAIKRLWAMTAELVVATNLHALDDDREEYTITGYGPLFAYQQKGYNDA